jgi:hypothetical protein
MDTPLHFCIFLALNSRQSRLKSISEGAHVMRIVSKNAMAALIGCVASSAVAAENPAAQLSLRTSLLSPTVKAAQIDPAIAIAREPSVSNGATRTAQNAASDQDEKRMNQRTGNSNVWLIASIAALGGLVPILLSTISD